VQLVYSLRQVYREMKLLINGSGGVQESGDEFTNVLRAAFEHKDPKSAKRHWQLDCLLAFLGSSYLKVALRHVDEINPWVNL